MRSPSSLERKTRELLRTHRMLRPPVDVHQLAGMLGIEVATQPPQDAEVSGALMRDQDRVIIGVNADHSWPRQRFTVAHELGHFMLHESTLQVDHHFGESFGQLRLPATAFRDRYSSLAVDPNEIEANRFAAALLMPMDFLEKSLRRLRSSLDDDAIVTLSKEYEVSAQAMRYRLMNLGVALDVAGER